MNSITSSIVSSLGAGSGIDMASLATNLAHAQFQPRLERIAQQSETLERQISLASELRNSFSLLASSLGDRIRMGDLAPQPQLANASVAQAKATTGATGGASYQLEVLNLASAQTLHGPAFANASDPVGSGSLTIRFGEMDGTGFAPDGTQPAANITIAPGSGLSDIAAAINAAGIGISAYVAHGTDGAQLVFKGKEGAAQGFTIEATETPGDEGLSALAWEPATGSPAHIGNLAQDARFLLDGVSMQAASNKVGEVAPGLSLVLTGTNAGAPTSITFSNPQNAVSGVMQDLTSALNEIAGQLNEATGLGGDLARDPGARALRKLFSELAGTVIMPNAAPGAPRTLADLGLATTREGGFRLDTTRLNAALAHDVAGATAMFTTGIHGVFATIDRMARNMNATQNPASLAGSVTRYTGMMARLDEQGSNLLSKQEALRDQLTRRFAVADSRIGASQSTLTFLKSQIDAWNAGRN